MSVDVGMRTCKTERMNVQRILARVMLVIGGLFWVFAPYGAKAVYQNASFVEAASFAAIFAAAVIIIFVLSLFFETLAAVILAIGAVAVVVWGLVAGWEGGVWLIMAFVAILPMAISSALYFAAANMQRICALEE